MKHKKSFLGVGWKFPPSFDRKLGSVMLVSEEDDIRESLFILLSTKPGERIMTPEFGCNLHFVVFENIDASLMTEIRNVIEQAVLYFEPRITLEKINIVQDPADMSNLNIELIYTVRKTNTRSNMVYPFYIIEGTNVQHKPKTKSE
ncbi:GPW/gp25 family protein [Reichenbachiella carrageenanivorans]|uniref:GPW/gp25 family protein n=1 Tax=Reichenbachiella carrageenanivorans TaxID=2979869 RepID=A0ABY6CUY6_9BACT|nr:GPW/gp25 family protein [Reichenbachiella carrageenanivorans]UXX77736.1 GPW/gp25 family protein [Reichenbachiella carrageenanivorans]